MLGLGSLLVVEDAPEELEQLAAQKARQETGADRDWEKRILPTRGQLGRSMPRAAVERDGLGPRALPPRAHAERSISAFISAPRRNARFEIQSQTKKTITPAIDPYVAL